MSDRQVCMSPLTILAFSSSSVGIARSSTTSSANAGGQLATNEADVARNAEDRKVRRDASASACKAPAAHRWGAEVFRTNADVTERAER